MKIETEDFLRLVENNNSICFFDIESTGFKGDYDSIICGSILGYKDKKAASFCINAVADDTSVILKIKTMLECYDCWVSYYGKGFDIPMLNTRLLKWELPPVKKKLHLDLYYGLKSHINTSRKSLAHLVSWLQIPEQKMGVSADVWNQLNIDFDKNIKILQKRCESDCKILRDLYNKTKHIIGEIKR